MNPRPHECLGCYKQEAQVKFAKSELLRAARKAARRESASSLAAVARARKNVEREQARLRDHHTECETRVLR